MRLIDLDAIMAQFPDADFDGDVIENTKAYPHWRIGIVGLINVLKDVPIIEQSKDCISREMAVRELDKYLCGVEFEEGIDKAIKNLPPVIPQPKRGKWIETTLAPVSGGDFNRGFKCSCCDYVVVVDDFNYCPNCGADMRESDKE